MWGENMDKDLHLVRMKNALDHLQKGYDLSKREQRDILEALIHLLGQYE